jgi:hypothetical protein
LHGSQGSCQGVQGGMVVLGLFVEWRAWFDELWLQDVSGDKNYGKCLWSRLE